MTVIQKVEKVFRLAPKLITRLPQAWRVFQRAGWRGVDWEMRRRSRPTNDYARWVLAFDTLSEASAERIRQRVAQMSDAPRISVLMPCYNPDPHWLRAAVASVQAQLYPHWELCIADDASPNPAVRETLKELAQADARIRVVLREKNGHISEASNSALDAVTAPWIALMDHDDLLPADALFEVAQCILTNPQVQLIYSDEDKVDEAGYRSDPYFKADWNPELFRSQNMFSHLGVLNTALVREVGGFRKGLEGSQDWDLVLRCMERIQPEQIVHIPRVLYHWRIHAQSTASSMDAKPYAVVAGERALNEHLARTGIRGQAEHVGAGYRVRYGLPDTLPKVSIIIPTRNAHGLVRQCVESIERRTSYSNWEILLVDNGSDDPAALRYFETLAQQPRIRVLRDDSPFNYSALNNRAAQQAAGEVLVLLNNDIEVLTPGWLEELVSLVLQPGVGAVGARLWYPNMTLQHGGVLLGPGGLAVHANKNLPRGLNGSMGRAALIQNFSAVTGACLAVRKSVYEQVGGLDETLAVAYNDIDFCLRLGAQGLRNIWTPYAELVHHESASRGDDLAPERRARFEREIQIMRSRWQSQIDHDPAYNPNLRFDSEDMGLAWPPRQRAQ